MFPSIMAVHFFKSNINLFGHSIDWNKILISNGRMYVSILAITGIQFFPGIRFKNFIIPIGIGFGSWLAAMLMLSEFGWVAANKFPFAYSMITIYPKYQPMVPFLLWSSVAYTALFLTVTYVDIAVRKAK